MSVKTIRLPNAADFSPNQVDLRRALEIIQGSSGDRDAIIEQIRTAFFAHRAERRSSIEDRLEQQKKSGGNPLIAEWH